MQPLHGVPKIALQTTARLLVEENSRKDNFHHADKENKVIQEEECCPALDKDRVRRCRAQRPPSFHYLPVFDDLKKYLGYDEPIDTRGIILSKMPQGLILLLVGLS